MNRRTVLVLGIGILLLLGGGTYYFDPFGIFGHFDPVVEDSDDTDGVEPTDPVDDIIDPDDTITPDETNDSETNDPVTTTGTLMFYVLLDETPVTGAECRVNSQTVFTCAGHAEMTLQFGSYSATISYGGYMKTKEVYVGSSGAHVEVNWVSDVPVAQGSIKVQTGVDGTIVEGQIEIWQGGRKVDSGLSTSEFTVDEGSYNVKARFVSSQTYSGTKTITVRDGERTYVTFDWSSGGGLVDLTAIPYDLGSNGSIIWGMPIIIAIAAYLLWMRKR